MAVAWITAEASSPWARGLLQPGSRLIVPPIFWIECANASWRIARTDREGRFDAGKAFGKLRTMPVDAVPPDADLAAQALALATHLDHPVYDCLYLALALARSAALATADIRFARAIRRAGALDEARILTPPEAAAPPA